MKLIYVASPYAGDVEKNREYAKQACRFVAEQGCAFFAPHLLYPEILNDNDPRERQMGLDMGKVVLARCHQLWAFGETISPGMKEEIAEAERLGLPVRYIPSEQIRQIKLQPPPSVIRICENIFELSRMAECMELDQTITVEDGKELFYCVLDWATECEQGFIEDGTEDYLGAIEAFGARKLRETFPFEQEEAPPLPRMEGHL